MKKKFGEIEVDGKPFTWSIKMDDDNCYIKIWSITEKGDF